MLLISVSCIRLGEETVIAVISPEMVDLHKTNRRLYMARNSSKSIPVFYKKCILKQITAAKKNISLYTCICISFKMLYTNCCDLSVFKNVLS